MGHHDIRYKIGELTKKRNAIKRGSKKSCEVYFSLDKKIPIPELQKTVILHEEVVTSHMNGEDKTFHVPFESEPERGHPGQSILQWDPKSGDWKIKKLGKTYKTCEIPEELLFKPGSAVKFLNDTRCVERSHQRGGTKFDK